MKNVRLRPIAVLLTALSITSFNAGWAKSAEHIVKDAFESIEETLKEGIEKLSDDLEAAQDYLSNYTWKGIIQDHASSGAVTLRELKMNGHSKVVVVNSGDKIECEVVCDLDRDKCSALSFYRVVIGIKGEGAQTTIGNELGILAGESREKFSLHAPMKPGLYQVRFKLAENLLEKKALHAWTDSKGNEPDASTTIGIIFVRK